MANISTNVMALPLVHMSVRVHNNETWVDSIKYEVQPDEGSPDPPAQLDLTGIRFEMEVRHIPDTHEVVMSASTDDGKLMLGEPPDVGFLIIQIPYSDLKVLQPGPYVGDIVASDGEYSRVAIEIELTIAEGITR
jgi:hypothetical protein